MNKNSNLKESYVCGEANSPLIYETIGSFFDRAAEKWADRDALVVRHQEIRWTYGQFKTQVDKLAAGLIALGLDRGDRVGIWAPNCAQWVVTQFATAKAGLVLVNINPAYRLWELEYALNKVGCRALITADHFKSSQYLKMLQTLAPELETSSPGRLRAEKLPSLQVVIRLGVEKTPGMYNFHEVCNMAGPKDVHRLERLKAELVPDDPINIQFTSGTTGSPKGATLSHFNILNNGYLVGRRMRLTPADRLCIPVPLYHCFGMVLGNIACITHGAAAIYPGPVFEPLSVLETVSNEKCTALHGVPTMFFAELNHPRFKEFDMSSLRTGIMAGSPCPIELMKRVISEMNMGEILIAYGQTELSPVNFMTRADDPIEKRVGTVGQAMEWLEVKIADENGRPVPIGQCGEVMTRGFSVMLGYWNDTEKAQAAIDKAGWLHSGDLGIMDPQGYLMIVGRIKDMVIRGGENIYPREIEEFLYSHPRVEEVQVFGVPDEKYGEEVCAWIKVKPGEILAEEDVKNYCIGKISHCKIPRYVKMVDTFPMTVTGKIQKFIMREDMAKELLDN